MPADTRRLNSPSLMSLPYGWVFRYFPGAVPLTVRLIIWLSSITLVTLLLLALRPYIQQSTVSLLYILVILVNAIIFGSWVGIGTSFLALVSLNYFFMEPYHTIGIISFEDMTRLVTFISVAVVASTMAGRARDHAAQVLQRDSHLTALYSLSQAISAEVELERILPIIASTTTSLLKVESCMILLKDDTGKPIEHARSGEEPETAWDNIDIPISYASYPIGTLRVVQRKNSVSLTPSDYELLQMIATQVALVQERANLVVAAHHANVLTEANRLKSTLLSLVSHDLRTPLAVMKGAVSNLLDESVVWEQSARREFLTSIDDEINHLNRLVGDLLFMSRIEAGALEHSRSWHDLADLVEQVLARLQPVLAQHRVAVDMPPDLPPVRINYTHIDCVLSNLLENAVFYTPVGTEIMLRVREQGDHIQVEVLDMGPGFPDGMLPHIFDKFVRGDNTASHSEGSGLGLAICKGLIEAHGGTICVRNRPQGGASIAFILPQESEAATHRAHSIELKEHQVVEER